MIAGISNARAWRLPTVRCKLLQGLAVVFIGWGGKVARRQRVAPSAGVHHPQNRGRPLLAGGVGNSKKFLGLLVHPGLQRQQPFVILLLAVRQSVPIERVNN